MFQTAIFVDKNMKSITSFEPSQVQRLLNSGGLAINAKVAYSLNPNDQWTAANLQFIHIVKSCFSLNQHPLDMICQRVIE